VNEAVTGRKAQERKHPYEARRPQTRGRTEGNRPAREGNRPLRHNFVVELKDLIVVPNIADRLRPLVNADKVLGLHKDVWCEFHQAFGHHINKYLALGHQLDEFVNNGFLKDYLAGSSTAAALTVPEEDQAHEMPIHGEVHTISGGFSGGGCTSYQRKRYVRSVNSVAEEGLDDPWESDLVFTKADLRDVVPHDNDPMVISVVTVGRRVHRVLVDQGRSADVMFWSTFNKMQLSPNLLRPYKGCLYGFAGDQVEVRGYLELRTTCTDGTTSRTESIRYLVVNANLAYNILLGRTSLNRLRAVASTRHMKMKLPDLSGRVIMIKSVQEEARKCYDNSLKTKRGVFMVMERPPIAETPMEVEPLEEAEPVEATPAEAVPAEEAPRGLHPWKEYLVRLRPWKKYPGTPRQRKKYPRMPRPQRRRLEEKAGEVSLALRALRTGDPSQRKTWWRVRLWARSSNWGDC